MQPEDHQLDRRELLRRYFGGYGPDWDAAIEAGVDVSILDENIRKTMEERLYELQRVLDMLHALREGMDDEAGQHRTDPAPPRSGS